MLVVKVRNLLVVNKIFVILVQFYILKGNQFVVDLNGIDLYVVF